ncbi:hypothetical protein TBLA_0A09070 [Henningerozyma blattae CBS 6284]|uniref:Uncharacterized protein n=1 Tax=Henningerozyma blattae (strain ATCC 34711 / CBS 6284 / DSM 70876 / NBRC 10599 / NRRL Y-10934 / UCD 77-7) TaxID=1071380 RepID=I2GX43_HENB6|nr:hypothetical protein TBLA_0A09070 [Tetrapisispora blattae CBS 6284]CCH58695.1 hypothetical protein TBLA_0A09070 [Tetrapisispora blattae CBS 6284]
MKNISTLHIQPDFNESIQQGESFYLNIDIDSNTIDEINFEKTNENEYSSTNDLNISFKKSKTNLFETKINDFNYEFQTGQEFKFAQLKEDPNQDINVTSIDGTNDKIVVGDSEGNIEILNNDNTSKDKISFTESLVIPQAHFSGITKSKIFPSGVVLLTGSIDMSINIFSMTDGSNPRTFKGHSKRINDLDMIERGKNFISCSDDGTIRLWECSKGVCEKVINRFENPYDGVTSIRVDPLNNQIIYGSYESGVVVGYDLRAIKDNKIKQLNSEFMSSCIGVELLNDNYILTGYEDGILCKWDKRKDCEIIESIKICENLQKINMIDETRIITSDLDSTTMLNIGESVDKIRYLVDEQDRGCNDTWYNKNTMELMTVGKYNKFTIYNQL